MVIKSLYHADLERGLDKVFAEAQTLQLLGREHPSIIGVQDCNFADEAQERPYIVMDYFPGVRLQAYLEQLGPETGLPLEDFLPIARQIAEAMLAAHGRGILHRDLKPDNVLVLKNDGGWLVKVIDFGLAVRLRTVRVSTSRPVSERTIYGSAVAGTAKYAWPEQMGETPGVEPDTYSDVYTFGKLCCYALFRDTEPKRRQWASLPTELADMLECCVEKDLEHRHRTFMHILATLAALGPVEVALGRTGEKGHREIDARRLEQAEMWPSGSGDGARTRNVAAGSRNRKSREQDEGDIPVEEVDFADALVRLFHYYTELRRIPQVTGSNIVGGFIVGMLLAFLPLMASGFKLKESLIISLVGFLAGGVLLVGPCLLRFLPIRRKRHRLQAVISRTIADIKATRPMSVQKWGGPSQTFPELGTFAWQTGYGAFTVKMSQGETVRRYIERQQEHHRRRTFQEEFVAFLKAHGIEYDERYLWE